MSVEIEEYEPEMSGPFSALVGRIIRGLYRHLEGSSILVATDAGYYVYECEGDCCSRSWFSDLLNVEVLTDQKVISVQVKELPKEFVPPEVRDKYECLQVYGYSIRTQFGVADIVFRNSSNGFYGGWVKNPIFHERFNVDGNWVEVKDDWSD